MYTIQIGGAVKATLLDLRYRMNDVLKAIDRNENVTILYHGKRKGVIVANSGSGTKKVTEHPFFNMLKGTMSVEREMMRLREGRYRDI
jgi:hypothetical protein